MRASSASLLAGKVRKQSNKTAGLEIAKTSCLKDLPVRKFPVGKDVRNGELADPSKHFDSMKSMELRRLGQDSIDHAIAAGMKDISRAHHLNLLRFTSQEWLIRTKLRIPGFHRPDNSSIEMDDDLQLRSTGFTNECTRVSWPSVSREGTQIRPGHRSKLQLKQICRKTAIPALASLQMFLLYQLINSIGSKLPRRFKRCRLSRSIFWQVPAKSILA